MQSIRLETIGVHQGGSDCIHILKVGSTVLADGFATECRWRDEGEKNQPDFGPVQLSEWR